MNITMQYVSSIGNELLSVYRTPSSPKVVIILRFYKIKFPSEMRPPIFRIRTLELVQSVAGLERESTVLCDCEWTVL